jgi:hypothetical protein
VNDEDKDDYDLQARADAAKDEYLHGVSMDEAQEEIAEFRAARDRMMMIFAKLVVAARDLVATRNAAVHGDSVEDFFYLVNEEIGEIENILKLYDAEAQS